MVEEATKDKEVEDEDEVGCESKPSLVFVICPFVN